jgi:uncharacterized protein involved in type VI secretion and phage assembly
MNDALMERLNQLGPDSLPDGFGITIGTVLENLDAMAEGRVHVNIPNLNMDAWARVVQIGGGSGRGFCWIPQADDEVLVAFAHNDPNAVYVLGGLWSTVNRPPLTIPTDFLTKRTLKTGVTEGVGHEIEFDDALQSITITSSTKQKITIDPLTMKLENTAGTLSITMDNTTQSVSIQAAAKIELKGAQISIQGVDVEIKGTNVSILADGPCTIRGSIIALN